MERTREQNKETQINQKVAQFWAFHLPEAGRQKDIQFSNILLWICVQIRVYERSPRAMSVHMTRQSELKDSTSFSPPLPGAPDDRTWASWLPAKIKTGEGWAKV